ncbi:MAG: hypothetical protein KAU20_03010, partial [Nanoarchaeota archaeon]|nr:hypothetical protein [Nanoarchaeota archaeon]
ELIRKKEIEKKVKEEKIKRAKIAYRIKPQFQWNDIDSRTEKLSEYLDRLILKWEKGCIIKYSLQVKLFNLYSSIYSDLTRSVLSKKEKEILHYRLKKIYSKLEILRYRKIVEKEPKQKQIEKPTLNIIIAKKLNKYISGLKEKQKQRRITAKQKQIERKRNIEKIRLEKKISWQKAVKERRVKKKGLEKEKQRRIKEKLESEKLRKEEIKKKEIEKLELEKQRESKRKQGKIRTYGIKTEKQKKDLESRYNKLLYRVNNTQLTMPSQLKLFMEYADLYSDLIQSSLSSKEKQELAQKLKQLYNKLKNYGR